MSVFVDVAEEGAVRAGAPLLERLGIRGLFRDFGEATVKIATPKRILAGGTAISIYKYASGINQANVSLLPNLGGGFNLGVNSDPYGKATPGGVAGSGGGGGSGFYSNGQPTQGDITGTVVAGGVIALIAIAAVIYLGSRKK